MGKFGLMILAMLVCGLGCYAPSSGSGTRTETPGPVSILALGDSYTIAEGLEPEARWPMLLAEQLRTAGRQVTEPRIIARTGWTTGDLLTAIDQANLQGTYTFVGLMIGVNNQYQGRSSTEYQEEFTQLVQIAISRADQHPERVMVLSIPDWGVTPFAKGRNTKDITAQIDAFNLINASVSQKLGVQYLDITPLTREVTTRPELQAPDGLHYSKAMHQRWASLVLERAPTLFPPPVSKGTM